ncbi:MAG: hypothetical protein C4567_05205 [Deltaproteobacteria bacterium]|nr:MAG: hypothetical protein C4567_05205 [Deltaproteobacteria bacterium]
MSYANAWNCQRCPQNAGPEGCPCWWEVVQTNVQTGAERLKKGCCLSQEMLGAFLIDVIKAANRPAASVESCRNEIAKGFQQLGPAMGLIGQFLQQKQLPGE